MNDLVPIDFHGDAIWAIPPTRRDHPLISLRPIVERFGLSWSSQLKRLRRDDVLSPSVVIMTTETAAGPRETVCLPLNLLPGGFLFGISTGSIPDPEVRERVLTYKRECHDVLYQHFFGRAAERQARAARSELRDRLKAVQIAMQLSTRAAARDVWNELGLPHLPEGVDPPAGRRAAHAAALDIPGDFTEDPRLPAVRQFIAERLEPSAGGEITNAEMFASYTAWAAQHGAPAMGAASFGAITGKLRLPKGHTGTHRFYRGLRFKPATPETLQ